MSDPVLYSLPPATRGQESIRLPRRVGMYEATPIAPDGRRGRPTAFCVTDCSLQVERVAEDQLKIRYDYSCGQPLFLRIGHIGDSYFLPLDGTRETVLTFDPARVTVSQVRLTCKNEFGQYISEFVHF